MKLIRREERREPTFLEAFEPFQLFRDMLRWEPFRLLAPLAEPRWGAWMPEIEVKETKEAIVLEADVPGLKEEDLEVSIRGNELVVCGKREEETRQEGERYHAYERVYGAFERAMPLPEGADVEHVKAELKDGVLKVTVPRKPEAQPRRIPLGKEAMMNPDLRVTTA